MHFPGYIFTDAETEKGAGRPGTWPISVFSYPGLNLLYIFSSWQKI